MLPVILREYLENGHRFSVKSSIPLSGGCINHALCLDTDQGKFFLKWNGQSPPGMFPAEARGLALILDTRTIRVPQVIESCDSSYSGMPGFILMEWIEPPQGESPNMSALGEKMAALHHAAPGPGLQYGLNQDNFIGSLPQKNTWCQEWPAFFRDQRLGVQAQLAAQNGRFPSSRRRRLDRIMENIERLLPTRADLCPSLLHGDLWSGNVISDISASPVLLDPAVYYGDREAEIAYTQLFNGFPPDFYQAYQSNFPLDPGYPERRDLYNLYHLINHLNHFGEMYGPEVDSILRKYGG